MMRRTIALAAALCLSACSGQRNESNKALNASRGDAGKDAASEYEDVGAVDAPDADEPDLDQDAGEGSGDAGTSPSDDAGGGQLDGSAADAAVDTGSANGDAGGSDSGASADTGASSDSSSGSEAGQADAGGQLRIRVLNYAANPFPLAGNLPVVFSYADGGVESVRALDDAGVLTSDTAPAMLSLMLPGSGLSTGDTFIDIVSVLGPQLGDELVFGTFRPRREDNPEPPHIYSIVHDNVPAGAASLRAYAGVEGCANGYLDHELHPSDPLDITQPPNCQLETPGYALVEVRAVSDQVLSFGGLALPPPADSTVNLALSQWIAPEDLTVTTANVPSGSRRDIDVWMRKQRLRVFADRPYSPPPDQYTFGVARSLVDSYDVSLGCADNEINADYFFRKNRPASTTNVTFDVQAEALPAVAPSNRSYLLEPMREPSAEFHVNGGSTPADALVALFSWWHREPGSDFSTTVRWSIIAPPDTTRVKVPTLPAAGPGFLGLPEIPAGSEVWFEGVEYYDSDTQNGYREFLKEAIGGDANAGEGSVSGGSLGRTLREGGTLRVMRSNNYQP